MRFLSITKRDLLAIAGLAMLAVAMLGIGILTSKTVREAHLMRDAETTAMRWANLFEDRRDDLRVMFRDRRSSYHLNSVIWNSRDLGRIVTYELYDRSGRLFYSTGLANWLPNDGRGSLLESPVTRKHTEAGVPTTSLHDKNSGASPSHYASVVIPFLVANDHIGSVVAFVDQSEQAAALTHSFSVIATATVILLLTSLGAAAYVVMSKSRQRSKAEARARYLSEYDELTGLPNRNSFNRRLEKILARRGRKREAAVIFIDIKRFKEINDALGHAAGDSVLRSVAERLAANVSDGDFVARLGSNEFAIVLTSITKQDSVSAFALTLRDALASPFWAGDEEINCTFSMGAALAPDDGNDQSTLARHTNLALNRAKSVGPSAFLFFKQDMDVAFQRRREREQDLRNAMEKDEFELYFQPQIALDSDTVCGQEALLRWRHPEHGTISPAYFIPLAEETGLIVPIGEWVLREACREAVAWEAPIKVAVNLSPVQFKTAGIADVVCSILDETGLDPRRLEIEVTESMLMGDTETVVTELNKLRDKGVAIAMDDFGTGYSSLSYISSFPFDKIKIDKAFIQSMTSDEALNAIVKCIIAMGHSLGVTITAEGVETLEQSDLLRRYGCHQIQGFLYGHPVNAETSARQIAASLEAEPVEKRAPKSRRSSAA